MFSQTVNFGGSSGSYRVEFGFQFHRRRIVPSLIGVVSLSAVEAASSSEFTCPPAEACKLTCFVESYSFSVVFSLEFRTCCGDGACCALFSAGAVALCSLAIVAPITSREFGVVSRQMLSVLR